MNTTPKPAPALHIIVITVGHDAPFGAIATTVTCTCGAKIEVPTMLSKDILRAFNKHRRGE